MAKKTEAESPDVLDQSKNGKVEDVEFMEQLIAEEDSNPLEPPRTDVLYGNGKKWITLSGGAFSGFASMQDIAQRWPKASGTFQRRFHFYKGGVKVHVTRVEDLNFNTYSSGIPVSNRKMKEMFPNVPFPWDDQEPPATAEEPEPEPGPKDDGPTVIYVNGEPNDPKFVNDDGDFYYQELGPDKKPTMHFYHLYDADDGRTEKVYFEHEAFAELTADEQRLFMQAHASPQVPQAQPQPQRHDPGISAKDVSSTESILTVLLNMSREDQKLAREELREERAAMRQTQTEMMKAIAEIKSGEKPGNGFAMGDFFKMYEFFQDMSEGKAPASGPTSALDGPLAIFDKITSALGKVASIRGQAQPSPEQVKLLQQIAAEQAANPNNGGGNKPQ